MSLRNTLRAVLRAGALCTLALCAVAAARAGTVQVDFPGADRFADAGVSPHDRQDNLETLAGFLKSLGKRYLAADQSLKVDVTEVDLAGEPWPTRGREIRIARGGADWPRITLRYTLSGPSGTLAQGEETVEDMNYQQQIHDRYLRDPLSYEKRMLDKWFKARFAPGQKPVAAARTAS